MDGLFWFFGVIVALDAVIIMGLPITLVLLRRPTSALAAAIAITAAVIVDYNWNLPEISAASLGAMGLVGLPAQAMPLSMGLIVATLAACGWAFTRDN
jgi:hypothetical protein